MALVAFCVALGFGIVVPAIPLFALEFGVGTTAAGAVVSAFALMRLVSGLAAGRLVDRVGERSALLAGLAVVAVSSLLAGLAVSYPQLLILRGVGGIGSAVFTIAATSLLLRVATAAQRGQTQSIYRGGFLVGGIIGPAFGGAVLGISLRAPFFLYAGTLALAALAAATMLPQPPKRASTSQVTLGIGEDDGLPSPVVDKPPRIPLSITLRNPAYQAALAGNFAAGFSLLGVRSTVVPLLVVQRLELARGGSGPPSRWALWCRQPCSCPPAERWTGSAGAPRWWSEASSPRRLLPASRWSPGLPAFWSRRPPSPPGPRSSASPRRRSSATSSRAGAVRLLLSGR